MLDEKVKISVIIPVYNAEEFLYESIPSVLNQSLGDIELLCVNDGSKDNSLKILEDFASDDSRVKIFNKINGGCGSARNVGLDNASGEYIYFFDPDDYILPNTFEELYKNAINNESDLVMFKIARFRDNESIDYSIPGFEFEEIFKGVDFNDFSFNYKDIKSYVLNSSFAPWTKLYKKEFLDQYPDFRFPLNIAFDDVPFHVMSLLRASKISFVPDFFYRYRLSNVNSVNNTSSNGIDIFRICDIVENFLNKENYFDEFKEEFICFKFTQILNYIISSNSEEYFQKAKEEFSSINQNLNNSLFFNNSIPSTLLNKVGLVLSCDSFEIYKLKVKINNLEEENKKLSNLNYSLSDELDKFKNSNDKLDLIIQNNGVLLGADDLGTLNSIKNKLNSFLNWKLKFNGFTPIISVILPSFNVSDFIVRCMDSVINQSLRNIEIICVDANSTDGTLEILKEYESNDSRVKLLISDKKSYGHQMNMGIEQASGDYIAIVETDDFIEIDMLEKLYNLTDNGVVDIAKANFWHVNGSKNGNYKFIEDGTKKNLPEGKFTIYDDANVLNGHPSIWAAIYRRKFLIDNNIHFMEATGGGWVDNPFLFETFCAAKDIMYLDEPCYCYLESNPNSSTNNLVDLTLPMERMINIFNVLKRYNCDDEQVLKAFYTRIFWHVHDLFDKNKYISQNVEVMSYIKNVVQRLDKNIVINHFNEDDQQLYLKCLEFDVKRLNVLFIASDNNRTSGAFLSMANLCKYLHDKYNVNVHVIVPMEGHGVEVLENLSIDYTLIPSKDWVIPLSKVNDDKTYDEIKSKKLFNKTAIKELSDFIQKNNIDIVHINTTYSYVGACAALNNDIPFVWHLREFLEEDQGNTLWNRDCGNKLINKSNSIIAISDSILNKYNKILDGGKLLRIHNGIDAERFYNPYKNILNQPIIKLIMVGGFEYYKGQLEFAKACVSIYEKGYSNFEVWFVGTGRDDVKNEVIDIFKSANIDDKVKYLGYKFDVENYFKESDISFTCAKSEAFGRTTVEAMLSGNLLIGADTAGTKELIDDGVTGILYKQGDSEDLANKIIHVFNNRDECRNIAKEGRNFMFENMTAEINADNIFNLYENILKTSQINKN